MKKKLLLVLFFSFFLNGFAQQNPLWKKLESDNALSSERFYRNTTPKEFKIYSLDYNLLKTELAAAPFRGKKKANAPIISFPTANGTLERFKVYQTSVMHADLAAKYPDIKSYMGIGIDDPTASIHFTTTVFGLSTMTFSGKSDISYIDAYTKDLTKYIVYSRENLQNDGIPFECHLKASGTENKTDAENLNTTFSNNGVLRTYRLAVSSTIEYSAFHIAQAGVGSGTTAQKTAAVLAAMVVTMARVNGVYETDLGIHLELIANNNLLINITTDTFTNNDGGELLGENQSFVNSVIGSANYDIGHVFSTGGGGIASLQSVCSGAKAQGVTGSGSPVNDAFNIDYVAHEMGHQFGGNHTFNTNVGSCGGNNRNDATAVEPGSGTTIMAYAGICSPNNVQNNSDAHFSFISLAEINAFVNANGGTCAVNTVLSNTAPVISGLTNYTIPKGTSFVLKASATDAENDPITYCWEQKDNQISTQPPVSTSTSGPNFRSRPPSVSPERYFPALNGSSAAYEIVPTVARTLNFALTVRDNSPEGPQTSRADMSVTVSNIGPFVLTSPNSSVSWAVGSNQTVTWDVAGTNANGINVSLVDIYLSTNSGNSYPVLLASQVPNDGSETITIPNLPGSSNKIMVRAVGNIFYDVSNTTFAITAPTSTYGVAFNGVQGEQNKGVCVGNSAVFSFNYAAYAGFNGTTTFNITGNPSGSTVTFSPAQMTSDGMVTATIATTNAAAVGTYPLTVTATSGATSKTVNFYLTLFNSTFNPQALSSPVDGILGVATDVTFSWATNSSNTNAYVFDLSTDPNFLNATTATVAATSYMVSGLAQTTTYYWRVTPKNDGCSGTASAIATFKTGFCGGHTAINVPLTISASGTPIVNSVLTIPADDNITINDVNVTLDISHAKINNITALLISPAGTQVTLFANQCGPLPGYQNAVLTLDDSGTTTITCSTTPPAISGRFKPTQFLSAFNGQNSQGNWTLRLMDNANGNGGSLNSWSLNICSEEAPMGVDDVSDSRFTVFPNPSNGSFTIQSDKINSDKVRVQVYDIQGRVIFDTAYSGANQLNERIQLKNAQAGIYLLLVTSGDSREVKRIVVK